MPGTHVKENSFLTETNPFREPAIEPRTLGKVTSEHIGSCSVQQLKIGRVADVDAAQGRYQVAESARAEPSDDALGLPIALHPVHDFCPSMPGGDHVRNQVWRVLEVGVHGDDRVASGGPQTGEERCFLAEVACELQTSHSGIDRSQFSHPLERFVRAAVVHHDYLVLDRQAAKDRRDPLDERLDARGLTVGRYDNADQGFFSAQVVRPSLVGIMGDRGS